MSRHGTAVGARESSVTAAYGKSVRVLFGARDEHVARQKLNPLHVDSRELAAVFAIGRSQERSPESRMIRPSGPKMGMDVMGDVIDGRDRKIDQEFDDCRIEAEQDLSGVRIGAHGAPCGDEGCAGEGKGGVAGERGVERGFADLPFGIVNDGLPPGSVAELEIEEQERACTGP